MPKVVVMVDEMIVRVTLALVMPVDVWPKEQAAQADESTFCWACQKATSV